ncbi:MAG: anthranilate phosphoribosyltransferase family protein [Leptolyngbya sp. SIO1E4]|nr:anthranilate phosphoribosyltransferase family protein [Leptolyngbya sp. SIO1E4]
MSQAFRALLKKVGSGRHTSESLTRSEATEAALMMLTQEATPAQIGAFMIAHRIKRPTAEELAGFLDAYDKIGPKIKSVKANYPTMVFGIPYDGRSRTAPVQPLVSLMLSAMGCPVLLHGGSRMPTKYGIPLIEIWQSLGVDWKGLSLDAIQEIFQRTCQGFIYLPDHFPGAHSLVPYRDQIGKRPPLATIELMWCPYQGNCQVVVGYVHPPTEELAKKTLTLTGNQHFITVKGLEGSSDLPRARTAIIGIHQGSNEDRLLLHARDYDLGSLSEEPLQALPDYLVALKETLHGKSTGLSPATVWSGGFYLWQSGITQSLKEGIEKAKALLGSDRLIKHLSSLIQEINLHRNT